ncbi:hypothetical protein [Nocardia otitidiscaviarum]|uniref:hypothetical protein n=1 Tax=Nocardia otitidiscaviarum TaxID=1823 RepID=UPI0018957F28|nr:hypothetical protein [Nocardia otitidiscaviarum]MBF6183332.1 hypothetical protein [Nocardia otitidiscaviarum]
MSVDMYEYRFIEELKAVDEFHPNDTRDPRVWPRRGSSVGEFPAWRALFSALCLHHHSTGYRLFSYEEFFTFCENAYTAKHPQRARFRRYFHGELRAGMRQRVGVWYESGMAETYLYACLVEALEDKAKVGVVLYDPRADWKLKSDIVVHMKGHAMRISAYVGPSEERPRIEQKRDDIERMRKLKTAESAHWGNETLEKMPLFEIQITEEDMQVVNGLRLFSTSSINRLLNQLYSYAGIGQDRWFFPTQRVR